MGDKKEDPILLVTPDKTGISSKERTGSCSETFYDIKDKDAFFQTTKLFDIDNNRESLMLLKNLDDVDITRNSLGISREFLGLGRESLDLGRESLGILAMNALEEKLNDSYSISSILNRAILYSNTSTTKSSLSYTFLQTSDAAMHSTFDYPEVFSPIKKQVNLSNSLMKAAFTNSKNACDRNVECKNLKNRSLSLSVLETLNGGNKTTSTAKNVFRRTQSFKQVTCEDDNNNFDDSIFMEARVLAAKIGDGTILEEKGEVCGLDCIPQPEWANECNEPGVKDIVKSEDLCKSAENTEKTSAAQCDENKKITISNDSNQNKSERTCDKISLTNNVSSNASKHSETVQNISKIFQNKSHSTSRVSCSSNKSSKDAKEILENLSEIFSSENPTSEQRSEGQNLLYSLADILCNSGNLSKRKSSDDSGHSSIENEHEVNNAIPNTPDPHCKPAADKQSEKPPDLSTNHERKEFNRSLSCPNSGERPGIIRKVLKTCQVNIPNSLNNLNKLKPKKTENKKKGPLKAILPLGNMSKAFNKQNKMSCTPTKNEGNKKTSTPRAESKLRPIAQSTPDDVANKPKKTQISPSQLPKPKFSCLVSPLARPSSAKEAKYSGRGMQRQLTDSSLTKTKISPVSSMSRRKSSGDIKAQPQTSGLKRSNSISKDVKPTTATNSDNNNKSNNKSSGSLQKNRIKNLSIKSTNLVFKFRKSAGKENLPQ